MDAIGKHRARLRAGLIAPLMLVLVLALGGCGLLLEPPVAAQPIDPVLQRPEAGGKFIAFVGPSSQHAEPFLGVPGTNYYVLRSVLDTRTGEVAHYLFIEDSYYGNERNWDRARAADQELRVIPIRKDEITCQNGCSYAEEFEAALPEPLLRANPQGFAVVFRARSGAEKTLSVPGDLIAKQLKAVDQARPTVPAALPAVSPAAPNPPSPPASPRAGLPAPTAAPLPAPQTPQS